MKRTLLLLLPLAHAVRMWSALRNFAGCGDPNVKDCAVQEMPVRTDARVEEFVRDMEAWELWGKQLKSSGDSLLKAFREEKAIDPLLVLMEEFRGALDKDELLFDFSEIEKCFMLDAHGHIISDLVSLTGGQIMQANFVHQQVRSARSTLQLLELYEFILNIMPSDDNIFHPDSSTISDFSNKVLDWAVDAHRSMFVFPQASERVHKLLATFPMPFDQAVQLQTFLSEDIQVDAYVRELLAGLKLAVGNTFLAHADGVLLLDLLEPIGDVQITNSNFNDMTDKYFAWEEKLSSSRHHSGWINTLGHPILSNFLITDHVINHQHIKSPQGEDWLDVDEDTISYEQAEKWNHLRTRINNIIMSAPLSDTMDVETSRLDWNAWSRWGQKLQQKYKVLNTHQDKEPNLEFWNAVLSPSVIRNFEQMHHLHTTGQVHADFHEIELIKFDVLKHGITWESGFSVYPWKTLPKQEQKNWEGVHHIFVILKNLISKD